ncbi:hypothetical protein CWB99_21850 [Pseudoalteromonas rubra]|uniref:Beta-lactamase-related domain-containing protein n=1 Tax=Pseudoalteromonas rubra TaxID=43658 RepID=A0A5S3WFW0_9GAMM|nr:serine hydrolase domain-containing protein [Pseudoalteromonas rubra]TMP24663.1 hypothetical protein CWB99_21850 [Pseudoalteromonas rubra]TMP36323.1 hypothetical protein CWC00_02175 [Pseudoalteromonas rubra]
MYKNNRVLLSTLFWFVTLLWSSLAKAEPVDKLIKALMKERHIPGLQLAVIKDDKIVKQGNYGFADLQHQVPVTDKKGFKDFATVFAQAQQDTDVTYDLELLVEWGNKLVKNGRVDDGIAVFEFALTQNNEQPYYHSSVAETYELNKQYPLALKHYQQILTINPNSQYAKNKVAAIKGYL